MRYLFIALIGLIATSVLAQSPINSFPPGMFTSRSDPTPFFGPGDLVSGALYWYGLRAYSASYAASLGNSIFIVRASDSSGTVVKVKADGSLNVASANSFAGTDATCTGTISGTTLTCTGASGTPHTFSTLTSASINVQPTLIVSCGTFTGGSGTCTLNQSLTVSTPETITMQWALTVNRLYDQTGHGFDGVTVNPVYNVSFFPTCSNNLPCLYFGGSNYFYSSGFTPTTAQPISSSSVVNRAINAATTVLLRNDNSGTNGTLLAWTTNNTAAVYAGTARTVTATDNAWHAIQTVLNGASSFITVDATDNAIASPGTQGWQADVGGGPFVGDDTANEFYNGYMSETGVWGIGFSSGNRSALCHNQFTYWGTSTSC